MIGILVCGRHGYASGLVQVAESICGQQSYLTICDYKDNENLQGYADSIRSQVLQYESEGRTVICLCDMAGGFPQALCLTHLADSQVLMVTEVSLTLLVHLLADREAAKEPELLLETCLREAKEAMNIVIPQRLFAGVERE